jgi:hypothetical protein
LECCHTSGNQTPQISFGNLENVGISLGYLRDLSFQKIFQRYPPLIPFFFQGICFSKDISEISTIYPIFENSNLR